MLELLTPICKDCANKKKDCPWENDNIGECSAFEKGE